MKLKTIVFSFILLSIAAMVKAGPIGPSAGYPYDPSTVILTTPTIQTGKKFWVSSATVNNLYSSTITLNTIVLRGVTITSYPASGTSVYPATATASFPVGFTATNATFTGTVNGSTATFTGLFTGATIHGSSLVITGSITGQNISGNNTGDVTIGTGNGLSLVGQALSLTSASSVSTGSLRASDFIVFNAKLSPTGNGSGLTGLTKTQVGLGNVQNVDQTVASNITSGLMDPARLATGTISSARYLRGDSNWALLNSTAVGLGQVTNDKQIKVSDYTQKGTLLLGTGVGTFSQLAPGTNGYVLSSDSGQGTNMKWVPQASTAVIGAFITNPATNTINAPYGVNASTVVIGSLSGVLKASAGAVTGSATTSNLTEGSNLYFTTSRATNTISATAPVTYSNGVIGLDQIDLTSEVTGVLPAGNMATDSNAYIQNRATNQSLAQFHVTSGTVTGKLFANQIVWPDGTIQVSSPTSGGGGSGTVNSGTAGNLSYYATSTNEVSDQTVYKIDSGNPVMTATGTVGSRKASVYADNGSSNNTLYDALEIGKNSSFQILRIKQFTQNGGLSYTPYFSQGVDARFFFGEGTSTDTLKLTPSAVTFQRGSSIDLSTPTAFNFKISGSNKFTIDASSVSVPTMLKLPAGTSYSIQPINDSEMGTYYSRNSTQKEIFNGVENSGSGQFTGSDLFVDLSDPTGDSDYVAFYAGTKTLLVSQIGSSLDSDLDMSGQQLKVDSIMWGDGTVQVSSPAAGGGSGNITNWAAGLVFTPDASAAGTVTSTAAFWRTVGDTMELNMYWVNGTLGAAPLKVTLPSGYTINTSKLPPASVMLGNCVVQSVGTQLVNSNNLEGFVFFDGSDDDNLYISPQVGSAAFTKLDFNLWGGNNSGVTVRASFPVITP